MNYLTLINQFWQLRREVSFSSTEADLYYYLLNVANGLHWKNPFQQSNKLIEATLGVSEKTLISARNRLKQYGLIDFTPGVKRSPSIYKLLLLENRLENLQVIREQSASVFGSESGRVSGANTPDINKQKQEANKTSPSPAVGEREEVLPSPPAALPADKQVVPPVALPPQPSAPPGTAPARAVPPQPAAPTPDEGPAFEEFWEAYGKKVDTKKCRARWKALTPAQRTAALAAVPAFVAGWPDIQFRKYPLTWLNGECWHDDPPPPRARPGQPTNPSLPTSTGASPTKARQKTDW